MQVTSVLEVGRQRPPGWMMCFNLEIRERPSRNCGIRGLH